MGNGKKKNARRAPSALTLPPLRDARGPQLLSRSLTLEKSNCWFGDKVVHHTQSGKEFSPVVAYCKFFQAVDGANQLALESHVMKRR